MSYEEMMALDEQQLERRQVTKGARRKILQSIHKLKQRSAIIRDMEKNLQTPKFPGQRCIRCAIATIRQILSTPLKAYAPSRNESIEKIEGVVPTHLINDDNLPALLFRLIGLVTVMLFGTGKYNNDIEDEYLFMMFSIFDQVVNNDAFTPAQKQRVLHWMRCARKSVCPAELHRQRLGLPHSGKCEACHHKESMTHDPYNTKTAQLKFQQWFSVHPIYISIILCEIWGLFTIFLFLKVSTKSLGSDVPIQGSHCDMVRILQLPTTKFEWNQDQMMGSAPLSNRYGTSNTREFRSNFDTMQKQEQGPYTAQAFTQQLPQYRSQRSVPCQATSSIESTPPVAHSNPTMWSSAIYGSDFLDMNYTARQHASSGHSKPRNSIDSNELNLKINPWDKPSSLPYEQTDSTSGYSSSASERSSGAGSPRSRGLGQTLYDMAIDLIR
uniref:Circadian locomoter output cycles protein kaput n=1 Tax=Heterorhabditis bacteriophora TaxID=37862 RepID=A0A1I7XMB1_HETBA